MAPVAQKSTANSADAHGAHFMITVDSLAALNVKQLAQILSLSGRSIYRLVDAGKLPQPLHIGGAVRWRRSDIEQWLEQGCKPVRPLPGRAGK
jgi:excisionase family DNA binding protein